MSAILKKYHLTADKKKFILRARAIQTLFRKWKTLEHTVLKRISIKSLFAGLRECCRSGGWRRVRARDNGRHKNTRPHISIGLVYIWSPRVWGSIHWQFMSPLQRRSYNWEENWTPTQKLSSSVNHLQIEV